MSVRCGRCGGRVTDVAGCPLCDPENFEPMAEQTATDINTWNDPANEILDNAIARLQAENQSLLARVTEFEGKLEEAEAVARLAKELIHEPESWEAYTDLQKPHHATVSPEFEALARAVEDAYGSPAHLKEATDGD